MRRILMWAAVCCIVIVIGSRSSPTPAQQATVPARDAAAAGSSADDDVRLLPGESEPPSGPDVFGAFYGRTPCQALAKMLQVAKGPECTKAKWRLVLYCDPATRQPTTYRISGLAYRDRVGKWSILNGAAPNPTGIVYRLDPDQPEGFLNFLRVDENVLYFQDREGKVMVGNADHSYAMNRLDKGGPD
jgi:hypothetical protein